MFETILHQGDKQERRHITVGKVRSIRKINDALVFESSICNDFRNQRLSPLQVIQNWHIKSHQT